MPADWILANENWKCRYQPIVYPQTGDHPATRVGAVYAAALYVAMLQVGGGVGSIVPTNPPEYIFVTFCLLAGSTIWALIVGDPNPNPNPNPNPSPKPKPSPKPYPYPDLNPNLALTLTRYHLRHRGHRRSTHD